MNAPTLLIGLGGTGCKIIERVSDMATSEQKQKIAFVAMDTDINELNEIQRKNAFVKIVQTSTKQTVGEYLNKDTYARDNWFPVNAILNSKTLTEGAGQVRSISRLAFDAVVKEGKLEPLHQAIQSLYKVEENKVEQAIRVIIVSSLAGGTGSGLLLPVALYVRNYLATHFRQSANITRGFFILPEVFFEVIPGQTERDNLKANAYATLRELDAFLMKGDHTLPDRFMDSVKMEFPRTSSNGYEEYDVRPYDFCFLFDAQNADGAKLGSFEQYIDHAANCIYSQSIGPMNKRSNSSEDNTIRRLAREKGRNRYAGAGASMMIYPADAVSQFVALKWTRDCVSNVWLTFDKDYFEMQKDIADRREKGFAVQDVDMTSFYAKQIESMDKQDNPFAKMIVHETSLYKADGITKTGTKWKTFVGKMSGKISEDVLSLPEIESIGTELDDSYGELEKKADKYVEYYDTLKKYFEVAKMAANAQAPNIAYTMFKYPKKGSEISKDDYKLESYMVNTQGSFIHPASARYLLVKVKDELENLNKRLTADLKDKSEFFDGFEKNAFDNPDTPDEEETVEDLQDKQGFIKGIFSRSKSVDLETLKPKFRNYKTMVEEYLEQKSQKIAVEYGLEHCNDMIKAYEEFFMSLSGKIEGMSGEIEDIYNRYKERDGSTTRYVCASRTCLDKIYERHPFAGSSTSLDNELSRNIYLKICEYSEMDEKPANNRFFSRLFDEDIVGYFKNDVMRRYGSDIDIDIIQALGKEAIYEDKISKDIDLDAGINQYIKDTIKSIRDLSCPFIESPLGEAREPIHACTFAKSMKPARDDESSKAQIIRKELLDHGGEPDEDIPKGMIMFYQSFYGLRANDISKFAPVERSMTYMRDSGEYLKSYTDLIRGINPETHLSKEISPHIDKWWHIVTKMPDLDDDYQEEQEYLIYAAFFWGILRDYITQDVSDPDNVKYILDNDTLGMDSSMMTVSNGTPCDKFYEVLDAVAIYPKLVDRILEEAKATTEEELDAGVDIADLKLFKLLDEFKMDEPGIGENKVPAKSIFSIPVLMKKSVNIENYYEEDVINLLKAEIKVIKDYLRLFCNENEYKEAFERIVSEQFDKYLADIEIEKTVDANICLGNLFYRTCNIIAGEYAEIGQKVRADEIRRFAKKHGEEQ